VVLGSYTGRLGNKLFQYCYARGLAERLGFAMEIGEIPGLPHLVTRIDGERYESPIVYCGNSDDPETVATDKSPRQIRPSGYFQRASYYDRSTVRKWLEPDRFTTERPDPDELVVHVRRGDFVHWDIALPIEYYWRAISRYRFSKITALTDSPDDPFAAAIGGTVLPLDEIAALGYMASAKMLVISNSTFSWWGGFLSNADVTMPYGWVYWTASEDAREGRDLRVSEWTVLTPN